MWGSRRLFTAIIVNPLLKEYGTTGVYYSQPLSASYSKQEKLTPVVIDNICISFIKDWLYSASADTDYTNTRLLGKQYGNLLISDGLSL